MLQPLDVTNPTPRRIQIDYWDGALQITWRWFDWRTIPGLIIASILIGVLGAILVKTALSGNPAWWCYFLLVPHAVISGYLTWYIAAMFLNRSLIRVNCESILVTHGPIPWPGVRGLPSNKISQVLCKERHGGKGAMYYQLAVELTNRKIRNLLPTTLSEAPVRYMSDVIYDFLRQHVAT